MSSGGRGEPGEQRGPGLPTPDAAFPLCTAGNAVPIGEEQVQALTNYLWSRHLPVEPGELQRRAERLEKKFLANSGRVSE